MDVWGKQFSIEKWRDLVADYLATGNDEPIININPNDSREFDAIFLGGGAMVGGIRFSSLAIILTKAA